MRRVLLLATVVAARALPAQTPDQAAKAVETIVAQDIARHINTIAHDSMRGRTTPSRGLELTAQYVAAEFKRLGLRANLGGNEWIERYPLPIPLDRARSRIVFAAAGKEAGADLAGAARLGGPMAPERAVRTGVVAVTGRQTLKSLEKLGNTDNKTIVYIPPAGLDADEQRLVVEQLVTRGTGMVILSNQDSATFAQRQQSRPQQPFVQIGPTWIVQVQPQSVAGLSEILTAGGVDLAQAQADTVPAARDLPGLQTSFEPRFERPSSDTTTAPNVVGILEGSDPKLKREYIVVSAHMDSRGLADSLRNGANDNAAGAAALLALARAFSEPGARPRRSLVFLATSGGPPALWGASIFAEQVAMSREFWSLLGSGALQSGIVQNGVLQGDQPGRSADTTSMPTVVITVDTAGVSPIANVIADLNLDMIGRPAGDSVVVDGLGDLELATSPVWVAAAHPDLRLTVINGGTAARRTSDQFAFASRGIPSLYFHNGTHEDTATAADSPAAIDTDLTARIARLVFYVGQDIANADRLPRWTSEGRRAFLKSQRE